MTDGSGPHTSDDHRQGSAAAQPQPTPQRVGVDLHAPNQNLQRPAVQRGQCLPDPALIERLLLEHLEASDRRRQPVAGQVGDVGIELPQPVPRAVVAYQAGPDDGAVGVDDPSSGGPHRAVAELGIGDLLTAIKDARSTAHTGFGQPGRPQARFPDRTVIRRHLDFAVETEASKMIEIYSGTALYDEIPAAVAVKQLPQARLIVIWAPTPPPASATRRVNNHHRVAGHRMQRVGTAQAGAGTQVVARHRQPHRVDIAAHRRDGVATQRGHLGADGTGRVVYDMTGKPPGPVQGHRRRCRLLQRLVGEQPAGDPQLRELVGGAAAQQRRLHQHRRPIAESGAHRGDIGNPGGVRELEFGDRCQRRGTRFRLQVTDVVRAEAQAAKATVQDGLIPVIITL